MILKPTYILHSLLAGMSVLTAISANAQETTRKNLLVEHLPNFSPPSWQQNGSNSVAYGSMIALSVHASIAYDKPIILDPDSTLKGDTTVENYIAMMNNRNYFDAWRRFLPSKEKKYAFSNISIQQIPNNSNTKQAIKDAIDNDQPIVFTLHYWKGDEEKLKEFWRNESHNASVIFNEIANFDNEIPESKSHTMCIVGYDDRDNTFILQNSWGAPEHREILENLPDGTLKIPQTLNYEASYNVVESLEPLTDKKEIYRFDFYKLLPTWIMDDKQPPIILTNDKTDIVPNSTTNSLINAWYEVSFAVWDNIKVSNDVVVKIIAPGIKYTLTPKNEYDDIYKVSLPIYSDTARQTPPITATVTIAAYDTSGNKAETEFQHHFLKGLPAQTHSSHTSSE